jgi:hypothetical protein
MTVLGLGSDSDRAIAVWAGETEILRYLYRPDDVPLDSPHPYLHPLRTLAGKLVTAAAPHDHPWHKGLSWAIADVEGENFWGGPSYRAGAGYLWDADNGSMLTTRIAIEQSDKRIVVHQQLDWLNHAKAPLISESRELVIALAEDEDAWLLGFVTRMRNTAGIELRLSSPAVAGRAGAGYGGLFWRGSGSFLNGSVLMEGAIGAEELQGARSPWAAYLGGAAGHTSTVLMTDGDECGPTPWFVRTGEYPGLCAAPFFRHAHRLAASETLCRSYAVAIADGSSDTARARRLAARARAVIPAGEHASEPLPETPTKKEHSLFVDRPETRSHDFRSSARTPDDVDAFWTETLTAPNPELRLKQIAGA